MIVTTTPSVEGRKITAYHGVVVGEAIMGANIVRDFFASVTEVIGGRSGAYEGKLRDARAEAMAEIEDRARALGANAVVGVDLVYEVIGDSMLMVSVSGTAVTVGRPMRVPSPLDVLRVLPQLGLNLVLPAMVVGAVQGSMVDILLGHDGYPLAKVGVVLGPVIFAFTINALHRREDEWTDEMAALSEAYRKEETRKRQEAATARGELVKLDEHRATKR